MCLRERDDLRTVLENGVKKMIKRVLSCAVVVGVSMFTASLAGASPVALLNASFEDDVPGPVDGFPPEFQIDIDVDHWEAAGKDFFVNINDGVFPNPPQGYPGHLTNIDGEQAAFISMGAGGLQQVSTDTIEAGKQYQLIVALASSAQYPPLEGSKVILRLFYMDGNDQPVFPTDWKLEVEANPVGAEGPLPNDAFTDFGFTITPSGDAIGKRIGVDISATPGFTEGSEVGYIDVDNIRLNAIPEPGAMAMMVGAALIGVGRRRSR
jgi:hypothetical protein